MNKKKEKKVAYSTELTDADIRATESLVWKLEFPFSSLFLTYLGEDVTSQL